MKLITLIAFRSLCITIAVIGIAIQQVGAQPPNSVPLEKQNTRVVVPKNRQQPPDEPRDEATSNEAGKPNSDDKEKKELSSKVKTLVEQLDADKKLERDTAESTLLEIGIDALEFMPSIANDASPEQTMRINRVLEQLGKRQVDSLTQASVVTLSGPMSGFEALQKISQQTGNVIALQKDAPELNRQVETDFEETPYWQAIDEVLDQLDLTFEYIEGVAQQVKPRAASSPLRSLNACYAGIVRIEPVSVEKRSFLQTPEKNYLQLTLLLSWEPRLNPALVRLPLDTLEITCDNGEVLKPTAGEQETDVAPVGGNQVQVPLSFALPSREAKKLSRWKGRSSLTMPGKMASVEFSNLMSAKNIPAQIGNLVITLEKSRKNRDLKELLVGVAMKNEEVAESFRGMSANNEAYLLDKAGNRIEHVGWSTTRMNKIGVGVSYLFDVEGDLDDCRFIYRAPGAVINHDVAFELMDIPLP